MREVATRDPFERALAFVRARGVLRRGERVLVASGGGAASIAVIAFVALARQALALDAVRVIAVNDGASEPDLDAEEGAVEAARAARSLGLEACVIDAEGADPIARALRERRTLGWDRVAIGHTLEDGAARVLRQWMGAQKLRGLAARRRDGLVRPLLSTSAADADEITRLAGLQPPTAPLAPARGASALRDRAVREAILPRIRALWPGCDEAICALPAQIAGRTSLRR